MKNKKLTYSEKIDNIVETLSKHPEIKISLETWDSEEARDEGLGEIHPITLLTKSKDFFEIALAAEDKLNDFACIEIVYGPNDQTIWHIDEDTCDPEIDDFDYQQFMDYAKSLEKVR